MSNIVCPIIHTNNSGRSKLPVGARNILDINGPLSEVIDVMDSDDLHSIASYMARPTTQFLG